jgi:hypothetical protein
VAANAQGETIAVWRGVRRLANGRTTEAVQSAFRRPSQAFGATQTIRDAESERLTVTGEVVALDSRGTAYAAYNAGTSPVVRLASRARGASGSWHAPRDLAAAPSSNPVIDVTVDRTAIVAWRASELDSEGNGIQSGLLDTRSRAPDGTLSASQRLSATPTRNYRLAVAPSGEALLSWVPSAPDTADLRYATRPPGGPFGAARVVAGVGPGQRLSRQARRAWRRHLPRDLYDRRPRPRDRSAAGRDDRSDPGTRHGRPLPARRRGRTACRRGLGRPQGRRGAARRIGTPA